MTPCDSLETTDQVELENRIHQEFWTAFAAWEEAPVEQKAEASARLNNCVRELYDFVVRGKVPQTSRISVRAVSAGVS